MNNQILLAQQLQIIFSAQLSISLISKIKQKSVDRQLLRDCWSFLWSFHGHAPPFMNKYLNIKGARKKIFEGNSKPIDIELVAKIHFIGGINYVLHQLLEILDKEEVCYFISPIIEYSIINDPNLKLPIKMVVD